MREEGPLLESLTRRLAECPPEFLRPPKVTDWVGEIDVKAVVCDHLRAMKLDGIAGLDLSPLDSDGTGSSINRLRLILLATWILHDDWFLQRPRLAPAMWSLLSNELNDLAEVVGADEAVKDPDRREELIRVCLSQLGLRPLGETEAQAVDRLATLDSAERIRVIRKTRAAEARAREIRQRMAEEAARAAAARYSPE